MTAFENYTVKYDDDYGKKIYEIIMFAFTAPFLSEIRTRIHQNQRVMIPNSLIMGAESSTGKTQLMKLISKMIQVNSNSDEVIEFKKMEGEHSRKNTQPKEILRSLTQNYESVYPIFVDEVVDKSTIFYSIYKFYISF